MDIAAPSDKKPTVQNPEKPDEVANSSAECSPRTAVKIWKTRKQDPSAQPPVERGHRITKTVTPKVLAANRRNAKLSTGPRTKEGKKWSSRNAIKHGILSSEPLIESEEDRAAFHGMLGALRRDFQPQGQLEELLVEEIANGFWGLRLAKRFEAQAMTRAGEREFLKVSDEGALTAAEAMQLIKESVEEAQRRAHAGDEQIVSSLRRISTSSEEFCAHLGRIRAARFLDACTEHDLLLKAQELGLAEAFEAAMAARAQQCDAGECANPVPLATRLPMPIAEDQNRILRYRSGIFRELAQNLNQLERLQRSRRGDHVPAPVHVNLSTNG